jgi:hypothetical protein
MNMTRQIPKNTLTTLLTTICMMITHSTGCSPDQPDYNIKKISLSERTTSNYRNTHPNYPLWKITKNGNSFTLKTHNTHYKAHSSRANQTVRILRAGTLTTEVVHEKNSKITAFPKSRKSRFSQTSLTCNGPKNAELSMDKIQLHIQFDDTTANTNDITTKRLSKRQIALTHINTNDNTKNITLDVPFTPLGTLIFQIDDIPIEARLGLAVYVTKFGFAC